MTITMITPDGQEVPARRQVRKRARISEIAANAPNLVPLVEGFWMDQERSAVYSWQEGPEEKDPAKKGERKAGSYIEVPMPAGAPVVDGSCYMLPDRGQRASERTIYPVRLVKRPEQGIQLVTEAELLSGDAWAKWGGIPVARPRDRHQWANLVLAQVDAFKIQTLQAVDTMGWHQDPASGHWYYLLPDGRAVVDPDHPIAAVPPLVGCQLHSTQARAWQRLMPDLPDQPPTEEDVICLLGAYHEIAPRGHLFVTAGAAFRSLVCSFVRAETSLIAEGEGESGKTITQKHGRCVVGPSPYESEADSQFTATASKIEGTIAPLADYPCLIDNFRLQLDALAAELRDVKAAIDRVALAGYSGEEMRGRARRDGSPQEGRTVRSLCLMNGEQIPNTLLKTTLRRVMVLRYDKDPATGTASDIDIPVLVAALPQLDQILTRWGHALLRRLLRAANTDAAGLADRITAREEAFYTLLLEQARAACAAQDIGLYYSVARSWARVLTGWWLAEWALGLARDDQGHGPYTAEALPHVVQHMTAQLLRMAGVLRGEDGLTPFARLALRLAERIRDHELIAGQTWQLLDLEAACRGDRQAPDVDGTTAATWGEHLPTDMRSPVTAGYVSASRGEIYLLPKAIDYLRKQAAQQQHQEGSAGLATEGGLWQAALAEGWIARKGDGKNRGVKLHRSNKLGRGWALRLPLWLDQQPEEEEGRQTP